jgi:hypothetical protein
MQTQASDISWSGRYNFETTQILGAPMNGETRRTFFQHHLILNPKIVAVDGVNIYGRFDLLNNDHSDLLGYKGGSYFSGGTTSSETQDPEDLEVNLLYMTWITENGTLLAGRIPMHFGLGTYLNAGTGPFDHFLDNTDGVGYKMAMGNISFFPVFGAVKEGVLDKEDEIYQYYFNLQYENPDTDLEMGVSYDARTATIGGNDSVGGEYDPSSAGTITGDFHHDLVAVFARKKFDFGTLGFEADILTGETGIENADEDQIKLSGLGMVLEFDSAGSEPSTWDWGIKTGYFSGDDPETEDVNEGFSADRNYDVGVLMFNHVLGKDDVLGGSNRYINDKTGLVASDRTKLPDVEAITNAAFIAPNIRYYFNDKWTFKGNFVWGQLVQDSNDSVALGSEIDLSLYYSPNKSFTFGADSAFFFPGAAFKSGDKEPETAYGIMTRAAVNF